MFILYFLCFNIDNPVRIVNGSNEREGRVEVAWFHHHWSTICDDGWDDNDAVVVCKQLGYSGGFARGGAYFGQGTGSILLNNVNCFGNESGIFECDNRYRTHDCSHHQDAGVVCIGDNVKGIVNCMNLSVSKCA